MFTLDWALDATVVLFTVTLTLVGVAVLITTTFYLYSRRHRKSSAADWNAKSRAANSDAQSAESERQQRFVRAEETNRDTLNWSAADKTDPTDTQSRTPGETLAFSGKGKTILIADDDPVVVFALSRRLQQLGFQVIRSPDAAHALMGTMKVIPDLVILDVYMPSGNGLAVCEMMASDPRYAGIPVIIHSVLGDEATRERCRKLGARHVEKSEQSWTEIKSLVETLIGEGGGEIDPNDTLPESSETLLGQHSAQTLGGKPMQPSPETADAPSANRSADSPKAKITQPNSPKEAFNAVLPPIVPVCGHARVLCIDGPQSELELVENRLSALGVEVTKMRDPEEAFWTCFTDKPHVVLIHVAHGGKKLLEILHRFVTHPFTRNFPVIFINHNNEIPSEELPVSPNFKTLQTPIVWKELFRELEKIIPIADSQKDDPLANAAQPINEIEPALDHSPQTSEHLPTTDAAENTRLKILCIDDDPVIAKSIATRLKPYAIEVKGALNGTAGYLQAVSDKPDAILLDLQMPNGDGHYALAKLKEHPRTKDIPVIMLTVETHQGVRRQMIGLGVAGFMSKPVHWKELFEELGHHVQLPVQLIIDYKLTAECSAMV